MSTRCYLMGALFPSFMVMLGLLGSEVRSQALPGTQIDPGRIVGAGVYAEICEPVAGQPGCTAGTPPAAVGCANPGGLCAGVAWCTGGMGYDRCAPSWGWGTCSEWSQGCPREIYVCGITLICTQGGMVGPNAALCGETWQCN